MKIAVYGSGAGSERAAEKKAEEVGRQIALHCAALITGGCAGLPHKAAKGAFREGGITIAYTPASSQEQHEKMFEYPVDYHSKYVFTPKKYSVNPDFAKKFRNVVSCSECDAAIIIGGRIGTLNEFTNLYDMGKVIGILKDSGGVSNMIEQVVKKAGKKSKATILYDNDPEALVKRIVRCLNG